MTRLRYVSEPHPSVCAMQIGVISVWGRTKDNVYCRRPYDPNTFLGLHSSGVHMNSIGVFVERHRDGHTQERLDPESRLFGYSP